MDELKLTAVISFLGMSSLLGLFLAPLIYRDAKKIPILFLNTQPWFWAACAIFLGPMMVTLIYWLIHYSGISNRIAPNEGGNS